MAIITEQHLELRSIPLTTRILRSGEGPAVLLLHGSPIRPANGVR